MTGAWQALKNAWRERKPRQVSVTLLALGVLSIASLSLARGLLALRDWSFLGTQAGVSPLYLALTGWIWSVVSWPVFIGLWLGGQKLGRWAANAVRGMSLIYSLYFWLERLWLYNRPAAAPVYQPVLPGNWPFLLVSNLLILGWVFWILERPKTKIYWQLEDGKAHE